MLPLRELSGLFRLDCSWFFKFPSCFRAVCSLCSNPVVFSNFLVPLERFDPCSQSLRSLSSGLPWFSNCLVLFERFASFLISLERFSPGVLKFSGPFRKLPRSFRAVCSLFSNSLVSVAWFALCSPKPPVLFGRTGGCSEIL